MRWLASICKLVTCMLTCTYTQEQACVAFSCIFTIPYRVSSVSFAGFCPVQKTYIGDIAGRGGLGSRGCLTNQFFPIFMLAIFVGDSPTWLSPRNSWFPTTPSKWKMLEIIWYQIWQRIAWKKNLLRIPSTGSNSQPFLWLRRWLSKCNLCSPCNCTGFGHRSHWQQRCAGSLWPQSWNEANHLQTFLQWCLSMVCFGFAPSTWACWLCLSLVFQQKWLLLIAVHCFPKVALLISGEALAYASAGRIFTTFPQFSQAVSLRYEPWAAWRQDDGSTQNLFSSYILIISTFWGRFLEGFHITVLYTFRISRGSSLTPRIHVPTSQLQRFGLTLAPTAGSWR